MPKKTKYVDPLQRGTFNMRETQKAASAVLAKRNANFSRDMDKTKRARHIYNKIKSGEITDEATLKALTSDPFYSKMFAEFEKEAGGPNV
jgi:hypothetical protein